MIDEENEEENCPQWGWYPGSSGLTAAEACCHCSGFTKPIDIPNDCFVGDNPGWIDESATKCLWYETHEAKGCPGNFIKKRLGSFLFLQSHHHAALLSDAQSGAGFLEVFMVMWGILQSMLAATVNVRIWLGGKMFKVQTARGMKRMSHRAVVRSV